MNSQDLQSLDLPDCPGVYKFLGAKKEILYIGKATSLKDRVKSYFMHDLLATRGPLLVKMLGLAKAVEYTTTDSVLEAMILEAHLIKKHKPEYNTKDKDNRSYNYVVITKEDFPRLVILRGRGMNQNLEAKSYKAKEIFGPFPHGGELREALKIIRKIFPYRDEKCKLTGKPCFNAQIGLCPGPCAGWVSKRDYRKQVKRIEMFFKGKKIELLKDVEREMKKNAKEQKFEEAQKLKGTLYSLEHIQDMALIKRDIERMYSSDSTRIEAYDIAHTSGKSAVGVMTVVEDGELAKSQYRKFKIKMINPPAGGDDVGNLREVLRRRLGHLEWDLPKIIVVDGGVAQLNGAKEEIKESGFHIDIIAVTKDDRHKVKEIIGGKQYISTWGKSILLANAEAHRFAIGYHRRLRGKGFRI